MFEDNPYLEDPEQLQHFEDHLFAIVNYTQDAQQLYTVSKQLSTTLNKQILDKFSQRAEKLRQLVGLNQQFLLKILPKQPSNPHPTSAKSVSKMRSTIRQFYRQWCEQSEQKDKYLQILNLFKKYKQNGKVLIPGCGLGRLALEFVRAGYATEGNQVSYFMLFGSAYILNEITSKNQIQIAPFIHNLTGYKNKSDALRTVKIPDIVANDQTNNESQFSMRAGEFIQVYEKEQNTWDGVVTCFFIDTAPNIFKYVQTISKILQSGGVWVNYGPLLYHFRQNLNQQSVQVSWQTLRKYILTLFDILQQSIDETTYCHDPKSSTKLVYRCLKFAVIKKNSENTQNN